MQAVNRVAKNTGILYARMAITIFISLYATRLVLAALGAEDFGLFNVVGGVIAMLGFLNASMAAATQRFMSYAQGAGDLEKVKRIFNMSTALHIVIAILVVIVFEIAGYFFFHGILNIGPNRIDEAKLIYQFMVVSTFFTVVSVPYEAVIISHENMLLYAVLGILEAILKLSIALYITYSSYDHLVAYGLLTAALAIFLLLIRRIYCQSKYPECKISIRKYYDADLLKEMGGFAGWSLLGSSSSMLANYGQGIVINMFFGTRVNAAQGIANQVSGQLGVFATTLMNAMNPMIAKSAGAGNRQLMLKATMMGSKISFFMLGILYIPFLIEMPYILNLWLKNVPEYTIIFCQLLLIKNLIEQMYIPLSTSINAIGNIRNYQKIGSILSILPLGVTFVLFSFGYSPVVIYISFIFFTILKFISVLHYAKINCDLSISLFLKNVVFKCLLVFLLASGLAFIPTFIFKNDLLILASVFVTGISSFLFFIWFWGLSTDERDLLLKLIKAATNKVKPILNPIQLFFKR
jgi:O-antigen/teichoic acid export membrane protein